MYGLRAGTAFRSPFARAAAAAVRRRVTIALASLVVLLVATGVANSLAAAEPTDVILVLDNSGSMKKNDPEFLLKRAVGKFVSDLDQATRIGIVIFDQQVRYPVNLGEINVDSRAAIQQTLDEIDYRGQLTSSPAAIERAIYELKSDGRDEAQQVIIFMTDGIVDTGDAEVDKEKTKWLREELAADAADNDIRVFGIAFTENADFFLIQSLAKKTSGEYFRALTPEDLASVFASIQETLAEPEVVAPPPITPPPAPVTTTGPTTACLDTLVAAERQEMEASAAEVGITAEQLCREMLAVEPGSTVVVQPGQPGMPSAEEDEQAFLILVAVGALLLLGVVVIIVLLIRRRRAAPAAAGGGDPAIIPEAFVNDINGLVGQPATQIGAKPMVVGRVPGSDPEHMDYFVIDKGTVGRRHAIIQYRDFSFWLIDQGSVNGTFLNGERIEGERQLKHGDRLKFHKYEFEFSMPEMDDGGHTVFADPNDLDATMMGDAGEMAAARPAAASAPAPFDDDDPFDETAEDSLPPAPPDTGDADDDFFDDEAVETELSARARAQAHVVASVESLDPESNDDDDDLFTVGTSQDDDDFDAEASAFFDEGELAQTNNPMDDDFDFDEAATAMPQGEPMVSVGPPDGDDEDFSESATMTPGDVYKDDALSATTDISVDDFMKTDSFEVPVPDIDSDEDEDATLLPSQVPPSGAGAPAIDDVFDITGDRTMPPEPRDDDDEDDDASEAPTKFHS